MSGPGGWSFDVHDDYVELCAPRSGVLFDVNDETFHVRIPRPFFAGLAAGMPHLAQGQTPEDLEYLAGAEVEHDGPEP